MRKDSGGMTSENKENTGQMKTGGADRTCRLGWPVPEALLSCEKYAVDLVGEGDSLRS
jgi:hypothetical protein